MFPVTQISIPLPAKLYNLILLRSGGRLDPVQLAISQVEGFVDANADDPALWTKEGLKAFDEERRAVEPEHGDPTTGNQWGPLLLANGTRLRMKYEGTQHYAQVAFDKIVYGEEVLRSVSQWVRRVARNTNRNAWNDVWVQYPGQTDFVFGDQLRRSRV